jgi:GT2 family glycosyltransferase
MLQVSVIIPYYNAFATLKQTLDSISQSDYPHVEIITIDDKSTDDSSEHIADAPGIHLTMLRQSGAAIARNLGVSASSGEILFFVDADVTIQPNTISEVVRTFEQNEGPAACFGQYTPLPADRNFSTVYKNLVHHFTHQTSNEQARTFWCGCGAVKRSDFLEVGGFDESFVAASVEDIDLGYRLSEKGKPILLNKKLQVTHGKKYTLLSLIRSDLFNRAIPWTKLMATRNVFVADLNLKPNNIISGLMLFFAPPLLYAIGTSFGWNVAAGAIAFLIALYVVLNGKILVFVIRQRGLLFCVPFFWMYTLTYVYSSIGFGLGLIAFLWDRIKSRGKASDR